jgi:hypothetical protein
LNKQQIQARIEAINMEMIQTKSNYAKLEGHLGEATHWLAELLAKEEESNKQLDGQVNDEASQQPSDESVCESEAA